jgi:hypothetical protein
VLAAHPLPDSKTNVTSIDKRTSNGPLEAGDQRKYCGVLTTELVYLTSQAYARL